MVLVKLCIIGRRIAPFYVTAARFATGRSSGGLFMEWMRRVFNLPATETQTGIVLGLCIFVMSVMSVVLVWQAQVIARQNAVIHMFQSRFGG
jgi:hypothetical protein